MKKNDGKVRGVPAVDQPREKLIRNGIASLSDSDVIALLLRSGIAKKNVMELSDDILKKYTLAELSGVDIEDLASIPGMGLVRASSLVAAFEINKRLVFEKKTLKPQLDSAIKVYSYTSELHKSPREKFIAIYLDAKLYVIKKCHVSVGTVSAAIVHPREVYKPAVECNASGLIVVHNHPSQDASPSDEDVVITEKLAESGTIMGIPLLDHIIVTASEYYSFKESGKI